MIVTWMVALQPFFIWYFGIVNLIYLLLVIFGSFQAYARKRELSHEDVTQVLQSNELPEFTFLIPMFNEAECIFETVGNVLRLDYRYKKVIVVNDGSHDKSLEILINGFQMLPIPKIYDDTLATQPIRTVYQSATYPELILIDKPNGRKYDAINAGLNASPSPYFIVFDADTYIDNHGFETLIRPILKDEHTICVGASIRIKNGCEISYNRLSTLKYPASLLTAIQGVEYLRAFTARLGWNVLNANFVISGAFAVFPKTLVVEAGGFSDTIGEDMEIVIRLHRMMIEQKKRYKVLYLSDPVAWTIVPEKWGELAKQRVRWHLGLLESLWHHKKMFFNPRYGLMGLFVYPFWVFGELLAPLIEVFGYIYVIVAWHLGVLLWPSFFLYLAVTLGMSFLIAVYSLFVEEISFRKYPVARSMIMLFLACIVESVGYHQLTLFWRVWAFPQFFAKYRRISKEEVSIQKRVASEVEWVE